jgi:hypothetical protein
VPIFAYVGLASQPAKVQTLSADRIKLVTNFSCSPGSRIAVELVNDARTLNCILSLRVDDVQPHSDSGYNLEGTFPLTTDELRDLA